MIDESLLRIANTEDTKFLLQGELKAIYDCLYYKEKHFEEKCQGKYRGYVN